MKTTLKVFAIINIVVGGLATLGGLTSINEDRGMVFISGGYWLANGIIVLTALKKGSIK